jgi:hypothetical protein
VLQIGVLEGAPEYQFTRISGATRLADGRIAVSDGPVAEVRVYGPDGGYLATIGGSGEGPGDFRYPTGLTTVGQDTLVVQDGYDRVYFAPDGTYLRREVLDRAAFTGLWGGTGFAEGAAWLADGSLLAPVYERSSGPPRAAGPFRPGMTMVRVSGDLTRADTLGVFGGIRQEYVDVGADRPSAVVPPFAARSSWALGARDGTVGMADSEHPQVHLFGPDGAHRIVRWSATPEAVTADEVEAWKGEQRAAPWTQGRLPQLERAWAQMEVPASKPYFWRADLGRDGSVWVALDDGSGERAEWLVFGPDGRWRGRFVAQGHLQIQEIGPDHLLGTHRDENDVEYLRMYALGG